MYPSLPVAITDFSHSPTYVAFVWKILHLMIIGLAFNFVIPVLFLFVSGQTVSMQGPFGQTEGKDVFLREITKVLQKNTSSRSERGFKVS